MNRTHVDRILILVLPVILTCAACAAPAAPAPAARADGSARGC